MPTDKPVDISRERWIELRKLGGSFDHTFVEALLAENERLEALEEKTSANATHWHNTWRATAKERDFLRDQRDVLEARVRELEEQYAATGYVVRESVRPPLVIGEDE